MIQLKILNEKQSEVENRKITYRTFEFINGNLIFYGFEIEYTKNEFLCRKVFKDAANSLDEINDIIDFLISNKVYDENIENVIEAFLLIKR